jgi:predicted TIM-barrel fold metal-dependent hydrolase
MTLVDTDQGTVPHDKNAWRLDSPGPQGWRRTARPGDPHKFFLVSVDTHVIEPPDSWEQHVEPEFRPRLPHVEVDGDGAQWLVCEGRSPQLVRPGRDKLAGLQPLEPFEESNILQPYSARMEDEDLFRTKAGITLEQRLADYDADGVDVGIAFPTKGGLAFATSDARFSQAMCRAWNRWAKDDLVNTQERVLPMAMVAPADIDGAIREVAWAAEAGFKGLYFPVKPVFGPSSPDHLQYNDKAFEPLWETVSDSGLPITFHVSSGADPRGTRGNGGAVINYVCNAMTTTIEPLVQLISSGVFERHPNLVAGSVESGIGWVPWVLDSMDYASRAHHMWVRPVIPELPSSYYRRNCFSTFVDDPAGLALMERYDLVDNFLWSNDYPHHEGSFPYSAQSIERQLQPFSEPVRAKLLGLNAGRIFGLSVPEGRG